MPRIEELAKEIEASQAHIECLNWQYDMHEQEIRDKYCADAVSLALDIEERLSAFLHQLRKSAKGT